MVDRTSGQQMQNIVATYDLPVEEAEALPCQKVWSRIRSSSARTCPTLPTLQLRDPAGGHFSSEGLSKADLTDWLIATWRASACGWTHHAVRRTSSWACTAALRRRR